MNKVAFTKNKPACTNPLDMGYMLMIEHGEAACAKAMGCGTGVARNKLNPDTETNQLSLQNAIDLTNTFNDDRMLSAWAASRNKSLFDLPQGSVSEDELTDQILDMAEKFGEIGRELKNARQDGIIDPQERQAIKQRILALVSCAMNLDAEVASQVRQFPTSVKTA